MSVDAEFDECPHAPGILTKETCTLCSGKAKRATEPGRVIHEKPAEHSWKLNCGHRPRVGDMIYLIAGSEPGERRHFVCRECRP